MSSWSTLIERQVGKLPKYEINQEAFNNLSLAKSQAYGTDRDIQMAKENVDKDISTGIGQAKDITSSTSALLSALANMEQGGFDTKRDLAGTEAALRREKTKDLYAANAAMIDEKDKAFMQNEMAPWMAQLQELQYRRKRSDALATEMLGLWGQSNAGFFSMMGGAGGMMGG